MSGTALLGGWLLDRAVGDPRRHHPVAWYGALAAAVEARAHRDARGAGVVYVAALVGVPAVLAGVVDRHLPARWRRVWLLVLTWTAVGGRSLGREAQAVAAAVDAGDLSSARRRVRALVGRDPSRLDGPELCRAAVESVAENTADAVVGPFVAGALLGPVGVVAHRCANTLDAMVGHRSPRYLRFGWAAARLDDVLGWAPARVTAALAVALAPLVGGSSGGALQSWRRDGHRHPSPNAGPCEAAFAGALGVRLGGPNDYGDAGVEVRGPLGDGPAPAPADVERAVRLSTAVGLAAAVLAEVVRGALARRGAVSSWSGLAGRSRHTQGGRGAGRGVGCGSGAGACAVSTWSRLAGRSRHTAAAEADRGAGAGAATRSSAEGRRR